MIEPVAMIVDTPAWGSTAGVMNPTGAHEQEQQRLRGWWLQAAARHANITANIANGQVASLESPGGNGREQQVPPFLPLHVAASQGMTDAGRVVLERARNHQVNRYAGVRTAVTAESSVLLNQQRRGFYPASTCTKN